jgi:hypothetical protein|tara:strand:- start:4 stop:396 length:393 start_codon:yes stop_codon:yes gene_type:complete
MSTIKVGTLLAADGSTTTQPSIPALDQRMAKAWVNFNGMNTVAINSAYNVSSITDMATGDYRANFTTAMSNTNYCTAICVSVTSSDSNWATLGTFNNYSEVKNTAYARLITSKHTNSQVDPSDTSVIVFA